MFSFMRHPDPAQFFRAAEHGRVELVLRFGEGASWTVDFSAGIERFIGYYPRVTGIGADNALLFFQRVAASA
jgi:hypothetical protein